VSYVKALLVDSKALEKAQRENDVAGAEQILQRAFQSDVRPLLAEARLQSGGCLEPLEFFKTHSVRDSLIGERGKSAVATGL
jgi:L-rhamnose isomerase/sugar isomerase